MSDNQIHKPDADNAAPPWHEQDAFWQDLQPFLFSPEQQRSALDEVTHLIELTGVDPGMKILDLGCGVGRHSLELARRDFAVTGVDRTKTYLDQAARKAAEEKLCIEFVREDMRNFRRPAAFDAVISLFTSFGYFDDPADDARIVANVFDALKPGGTFLIDTVNQTFILTHFQERDWHEVDGIFLLEERQLRDDRAWIDNRWVVIREGRKSEHRFSLRLYSADELTALLLKTGFVACEVYGNLAGTPCSDDAFRLVVLAHK